MERLIWARRRGALVRRVWLVVHLVNRVIRLEVFLAEDDDVLSAVATEKFLSGKNANIHLLKTGGHTLTNFESEVIPMIADIIER